LSSSPGHTYRYLSGLILHEEITITSMLVANCTTFNIAFQQVYTVRMLYQTLNMEKVLAYGLNGLWWSAQQ
jgi:hypothetical protein